MKAIIAVLVLAAAASALEASEQWAEFKATYGKQYNSIAEEARRFAVFQSNMRRAAELSAQDTASYGVTKFSDLTSEEFLALYTGLPTEAHTAWVRSLPAFPLGNETLGKDWSPLVSKVKDQGQCGSCWAFSAAAGAEGCYAVKHSKSIDLSAQQIVDCCTAGGSDGCNGGWEDSALEWAMGKDIATWDSYPYKGYKGTCKKVTTVGLPSGTCTYYGVAEDHTEAKIKAALVHNVVTIAIDATICQMYTGGVITSCSASQLNHAVLLVSDEGAGNSYVIKNSWGASWGEKGFFRVTKGKNCLGLTNEPALAY